MLNENGKRFLDLIFKNEKSEILFLWNKSVVLLEGAGWMYASLMCQAA